MRYVGIDLHKRFLVVAVEDERGRPRKPRRFDCREVEGIRAFFEVLGPFTAVIEASSSYRWLYELLEPLGDVILAHPLRLRAIVSGRAKTDKLDAALLAKLLRAGLIPPSYVPPRPYHALREITRARARLSRKRTEARNEVHALLTRANVHVPFVNAFCKAGHRWIAQVDLSPVSNLIRDELLRRMDYFDEELELIDGRLTEVARDFPEVEALQDLHGIGRYSALLVIAEIAEPWRFRDGRLVGAYAGLTPRVNQSGEHCYHGHITHQGSPWLRWILVQAAMHVVRRDPALGNFYQRVRKRSSAKIARVAVARKLAAICWVRLMRWHQLQAA
jgi:transposase